MKRPLRTMEVAELIVGICTRSSLPLTKPSRSSFSNTASKLAYETDRRMEASFKINAFLLSMLQLIPHPWVVALLLDVLIMLRYQISR